ncbi:hypothetical protein [Streptomyces lydicus]|uniref:hypothetical protein n=1 Tax=Streptomyces lydicus TaxID=47763 RepID=UPI0037D65B99
MRRIGSVTRWIAVAAVAGAAALGAAYTHLLPGSSGSSAPGSTPLQKPASSPGTTQQGDEDEQHGASGVHTDDDGGATTRPAAPALQAPAQPPAPAQRPSHATTGAS